MTKAPPLDGEGLGRGELFDRGDWMNETTPSLTSPIEGEKTDGAIR